MFKSFIQRIGVVIAVGLLAACGGGGGGSSCNPLLSSCSGSSGGGSSGGGTTTEPTLTVTLLDSTNAVTTTLPVTNPLTVRAVLKDANGNAVPNAVVSFTTLSTLGLLTPSSDLTNASGVATAQLSAAGISAQGAATIDASATVGSTDVSGSAAYKVGAANVTVSNLTVVAGAQQSIPAYGTTSVELTVSVNGTPSTTPLTVNLTSPCAAAGKATLPTSVQTINGVATATYADLGCGGSDTVTASVLGQTRNVTITSAAPQAANVQFVSSTPETIVIRGTGGAGLSEVATVSFKVVDASGNPVGSKNVTFDLTTRTGGLELDGQASGTVTKQSGADGLVSVSVKSGTLPTAVWVTATLGGGITAQSNLLRVSTGLPTQNRFSLSVTTHNIEGWDYDGTESMVNVIASDRLGNPVPNGTAINFISEGAQIGASCVTTNGRCSVSFLSSAYRPINDTEPTNTVTKGRVTILAYALGEETFTDVNGDNVYQTSEVFGDLGNAFVDFNENGTFASTEQEIPFSPAGSSACVSMPTNYPTVVSRAGTCDGVWGRAHVRADGVIVLSGSTAYVRTSKLITMAGACSKGLTYQLTDVNYNPMPAGTTISVSDNGVKYSKVGEAELATATLIVTGTPVVDTTAAGGTFPTVSVRADDCVSGTVSGTFDLTFTSPKGLRTTHTYTVVN